MITSSYINNFIEGNIAIQLQERKISISNIENAIKVLEHKSKRKVNKHTEKLDRFLGGNGKC